MILVQAQPLPPNSTPRENPTASNSFRYTPFFGFDRLNAMLASLSTCTEPLPENSLSGIAGFFQQRSYLPSVPEFNQYLVEASNPKCALQNKQLSIRAFQHFLNLDLGSVLDMDDPLHGLISVRGKCYFIISNLEQEVSGCRAL